MKKNYKELKVAIVHDWAFKMSGGEKVVEAFCEMYPNADVFFMMSDVSKLSPIIQKHKIINSFIQKLPFISKYHRYTYFLWPIAIESFNFNEYDLVISSSACASKGVVTGLKTLHVCYMHTPMRYAWDLTWDYFNPKNFSWWKRIVIPIFLTYLRIWDIASNNRYDKLIANSDYVNSRIRKYYKRSADIVIYPPVNVSQFDNAQVKEDYYVSIAPFEPNKRGDLVVEVAKKTGIKVKILGKGSTMKALQKSSTGYDNIEFLGFVSEQEKVGILAKAKGLFFVGVEDAGIVPIEALASGTPVIAYADGGALYTILDGKTGVHFHEQSVEALEEAILRCEKLVSDGTINRNFMRQHSEKYSKEKFTAEVGKVIEMAWEER